MLLQYLAATPGAMPWRAKGDEPRLMSAPVCERGAIAPLLAHKAFNRNGAAVKKG
jgi:hypothetical protein